MDPLRLAAACCTLLFLLSLLAPGGTGSGTTDHSASGSVLHLHLGAQEADVVVGGSTKVCVHLTEEDGAPVGSAQVEFIASGGRAEPASANTGDHGGVCVTLRAPRTPGPVTVVAHAEIDGRSSPEVATSITVVPERERATADSAGGWGVAAFPLAVLGLVFVALGASRTLKARSETAIRGRDRRRRKRSRKGR